MPEESEWEKIDRELTADANRQAREIQERAEEQGRARERAEERERQNLFLRSGGGSVPPTGGRSVPPSAKGKGWGCGCGSVIAVLFVILLVSVYVIPKVFGLPQLASAYKGTLHQTKGNKTAVFTLTLVKEDQSLIFTSNDGNLTAQAAFSPKLIPNGALSGNIRSDKTMAFTISGFDFQADVVNSVKSLSGEYYQQIVDSKNNTVTDIPLGTWQLTANA